MATSFASPGSMNVDWEERWNVDRLRTYRLGARARRARRRRTSARVLLFDFNNIRYVTSTHIGEWARDKMTRYALLTRGGEPHIWDFGSAAKHHRLNCPWLRPENIHAGMVGLRGAVAPDAGLFRAAAREIAAILRAEGVAGHAARRRHRASRRCSRPSSRRGHHRPRRPAGHARRPRGQVDRRDHCCSTRPARWSTAPTSSSRSSSSPGIRESELVANVTKFLFDLGSEHVDNINAVSGERCSPHPHVFSDRIIRPGDQAFFDIIQTFIGYKTCYYRTFVVGTATDAQRDAYKQAREWIDASIELMRPGRRRPTRSRASGRRRRSSASTTRWSASASSSATASACSSTSARSSAGSTRSSTRSSSRRAWSSPSRRTARPRTASRPRGSRRRSWSPPTGPQVITRFPSDELFVANAY